MTHTLVDNQQAIDDLMSNPSITVKNLDLISNDVIRISHQPKNEFMGISTRTNFGR